MRTLGAPAPAQARTAKTAKEAGDDRSALWIILLATAGAAVLAAETAGPSAESAGAKTWNAAAPLPPDTTAHRMTTCAWDVKANLFYVSRMTKPAYTFER